ncbi:hypothetical protein [Solibacillus sp. FSL H8-0538]|uniref:hypothetical protein n=1 Tax=Solibacillus sp. FSL H8-0538 TaxID=2921400 RepID=UPI0030F51ABB
MTKWKQGIDQHLGNKRRFTNELQQQILRKAKKPVRRNWQYPAALITIFVVALMLFIVGPLQQTEEQGAVSNSPLDEMIQETAVEKFFVSSYASHLDEYMVRDSSWFVGVRKFTKNQDVQMMETLLQEMVLTEDVSVGFGGTTDVLVQMEDGQQLKLKIQDFTTWLGVTDLQSKLFYQVEGKVVKEFQVTMDTTPFGLSKLEVCIMLGITLIMIMISINKLLPEMCRWPKREKESKNLWHRLRSVLLTLGINMVFFYAAVNRIMIHKGIIIFIVVMVILLDFLNEYYLSKSYKRYYLSLINGVAALIFIFVLFAIL